LGYCKKGKKLLRVRNKTRVTPRGRENEPSTVDDGYTTWVNPRKGSEGETNSKKKEKRKNQGGTDRYVSQDRGRSKTWNKKKKQKTGPTQTPKTGERTLGKKNLANEKGKMRTIIQTRKSDKHPHWFGKEKGEPQTNKRKREQRKGGEKTTNFEVEGKRKAPYSRKARKNQMKTSQKEVSLTPLKKKPGQFWGGGGQELGMGTDAPAKPRQGRGQGRGRVSGRENQKDDA